jgi:hypothetical protein
MSPRRGYTHGEAPPALLHSLSLKLKAGWRFDTRAGAFVSAAGERIAVADRLPAGSRIVPTAPAVAKLKAARRSAAEQELARHLQLLLPPGADPAACLRIVSEWDAVESATRPPQVSLP